MCSQGISSGDGDWDTGISWVKKFGEDLWGSGQRTIKKCLLCGKILLIVTLKVTLSVLPISFYLRGKLGRDFIDIITALHMILETIEGFLPSLLS